MSGGLDGDLEKGAGLANSWLCDEVDEGDSVHQEVLDNPVSGVLLVGIDKAVSLLCGLVSGLIGLCLDDIWVHRIRVKRKVIER